MAETILIDGHDKHAKYTQLHQQLRHLTSVEPNMTANLANIASALRMVFGFFWVGFYLVDGDTLVLGPFQGDLACTRIARGKGVCGAAWADESTLIVPDVDAFPGHIACSSLSRSEIVVPIKCKGKVIGVIDVDSDQINAFDSDDAEGLEQIARLIASLYS